MKNFVFVFLFFLMSQANGKSLLRASATLRRVPPTQITNTVKIAPEEISPARVGFSPVFGMQNGLTGYGGLIDLSFSTGVPFFIGISSGYMQFEQDSASEGGYAKMVLVPILASFTYRFNLNKGIVHPYLGLSLGASLADGTIEVDGTLSALGESRTDFMLLGRPGVEFQLSRAVSFFIEPQVGSMQGSFVFLPRAGLLFDF